MIVASFAMRGTVPMTPTGAPTDRDTALVQGPLYNGNSELRETGQPQSRIAFAGWIDWTTVPSGYAEADTTPLAQLLALIDAQGDRAVRLLRGSFVLAHISRQNGELKLYNGLTSIIPLFWAEHGGVLSFSSEPKDLLPAGGIGLDKVAMDLVPMLIAERGFPYAQSWFRGMRRLPAGHCLRLRAYAQAPEVYRFDDFEVSDEIPRSLDEAVDGLRARMAVACGRVLADADSAALMLSGGTDSAVVAYEAARQCADVFGVHFTLDGFPGYTHDAESARQVAEECGIGFTAYDMGRHVAGGGDYLQSPGDGSLPQTHVPLSAYRISGELAQVKGARFVLTGLLSDQVFLHDWHRGLLDSLGPSVLNPMAAGNPVWQLIAQTARSSFATGSTGASGLFSFMRNLLRRDPTAALPDSSVLYHHIGLTESAQQAIAESVRQSTWEVQRQEEEFFGGRRADASSSSWTTARLFVKEALNFPHLHAGYLNALRPNQAFVMTPFADRDVVEYLASVPAQYKLAIGHGAHVDKFLLRHAYTGRGISREVGTRMRQARIDAIPASYVHNNSATCRKLLGQDSVLVESNIVTPDFADSIDPRTVHRMGEPLARLCVIEQWLREFVS